MTTADSPRGDEDLARRISNEPTVGLLAGRALVLQLAHPAVAQSVADHSDFKVHPLKRLDATLEAAYSIVNGPADLADGVGRRIRWIHELVVGPGYRANAPDNLLWVHATLVDSALLAHDMFVGKLTGAQQASFYEQMRRVAETLGLDAADQPATLADFRRYFDDTVRTLVVSSTGGDLIQSVIHPVLPAGLHVLLAPLLSLGRLVTIGTTPAPIRVQAGLEWSSDLQRLLDALQGVIRVSARLQPRPVRAAPTRIVGHVLLHRARRHVARFDAQHPRPLTSV